MNLPIGFHSFHKNKFLNYQLNRWYSLGYARFEDIKAAGLQISGFKDYIKYFLEAHELAVKEGRLKNAATYLRAAEFLMEPSDHRKLETYQKFINQFDQAFLGDEFERHQIPYDQSHLNCIKIKSKLKTCKGTLLGIPGFDAFIEEFYCIWEHFANNGYDVIAFEGPGQGGSRRLYNQLFDHNYEKATSAVLNYFQLKQVNAIGISMGGYWILRAAALEARINKVIAMPPVYDWLEMTNSFNRRIAKMMVKNPIITNFLVKLKMKVGTIKHSINNALYIQDKTQGIDAIKWMLEMNKEHLHSHLIKQDVLLIGGENDAFQPPKLLYKQKEALSNAKSVRIRIFLKSESADQHCQMGNLSLALTYISDWLDKESYS